MASPILNDNYAVTCSAKSLGISRTELLVVAGIIAIVVAILLVLMSWVREQAKRNRCMDNLSKIHTGLELYANDNDDKIPSRLEKSGKKIWGNLLGSSWNPYGLGHLIKGGYVDDPRIFYCPVNTMVIFEQQYWFNTKGAESWMSYRYRNNNAAGHPANWINIYVPTRFDDEKRAIVADDPYLDWHKAVHKTGYNVLSLNGNVKWVDDSKNEIQGDLYEAWKLFDQNF
jgi:hypothetical protein